MKKAFLYFLLVLSISTMQAQTFPKVNLFFYLDATQSMTSNGLWERSKSELIRAIESIEDERTCVTVCVFADYRLKNSNKSSSDKFRFQKWTYSANKEGKKILCDSIRQLKEPKETIPTKFCDITLTNLDRPLIDFIEKEAHRDSDPNSINAMILITDGGHEHGYYGNDFFKHIAEWHNPSITNDNTFGWVVELPGQIAPTEDEARKHMNSIILSQESGGRLNIHDKIDFNFKFLAIGKHPNTLNIRASNTFNIEVLANTSKAQKYISNIVYSCNSSNPNVSIESNVLEDGKTVQLKINGIDPSIADSIIPIEIEGKFPKEIEKSELVTLLKSYAKFNLTLENRFARALNINFAEKGKYHEIISDKIEEFSDIEYYESWKIFGQTISKDSIIPSRFQLKFKLNHDALIRKSNARLIFVDKNNKPFDRNLIKITDTKGNDIEFINVKDSISEEEYIVSFNPELFKDGSISGFIRIVDNNSLDYACSLQINKGESYNIMQWKLDIDTHWNPLFVKFLWILFALLCLLLIFLYIIWHHRTFSLRFPTEGRAVFTPIGNAQNIQILECNFKEQQIVAPGGSDTILTELLNNSYIKEIVIINQNCNTPYIPQSQGWWDRIWNGDSIFINGTFANYPINHLVIKPSGTLTKEDINITINFQTDNATFINPQSITLPIHTITPTNPITPNVIIQKTNNSVCVFGKSPLQAITELSYIKS